MATPTIKEDLIDGSGLMDDAENGVLTRVIHIDNLERGPDLLLQALNAPIQRSAIGDSLDDQYPEWVVASRQVRPAGRTRTSAVVTLVYRKMMKRRLLDIRINGQSMMVPRNIDAQGNQLAVPYKKGATGIVPPARPDLDSDDPQHKYKWSPLTIDHFQPGAILEFVYRETESPYNKNARWQGMLNQDDFQGQPPLTWLCLAIDGALARPLTTVPDENKTGEQQYAWDVTYRFQYIFSLPVGSRPWSKLAFFVDLNTGQVPVDISPPSEGWPLDDNAKRGNGWAEFSFYGRDDFARLKLPRVCDGKSDNTSL